MPISSPEPVLQFCPHPSDAQGYSRYGGRSHLADLRNGRCGGRAGSLGTSPYEPCGMSMKVQDYLERAEYCERMAWLVSAYEARAIFAELARQWRDLARPLKILRHIQTDPPPEAPRRGASRTFPVKLVISGAVASETERFFYGGSFR